MTVAPRVSPTWMHRTRVASENMSKSPGYLGWGCHLREDVLIRLQADTAVLDTTPSCMKDDLPISRALQNHSALLAAVKATDLCGFSAMTTCVPCDHQVSVRWRARGHSTTRSGCLPWNRCLCTSRYVDHVAIFMCVTAHRAGALTFVALGRPICQRAQRARSR